MQSLQMAMSARSETSSKQGKGHSAIARQFGVSTSRISKINTGKIWGTSI